MGIKTPNIQTLTAPQIADTLLMASSTGGTARLSLEKLAQFLAEQDNAVKTAFFNKAHKSAQETVEKTYAPFHAETVAAADLRTYINKLPRLLTEELTITVLGGTCNPDGVYIHDFYGPGRLTVKAAEGAQVICPLVLEIARCAVPITMEGFRVEGPSEAGSYVKVDGCHATLKGFVVDGKEKGHKGTGCTVYNGGTFVLSDSEVKNIDYAINAGNGGTGGIFVVNNVTASNNNYGAVVSGGGIIFLVGDTPELVGGTANAKWGGAIFKSGELI